MQRVKCESTSCKYRRIHHEQPDKPRGEQWFDAPDDAVGPFYCSIECSVYGKSENVQKR